MGKFDLATIIEEYGLDNDSLCKVLFPNLQYPNMALNRILKGEGDLDSKQLIDLAEFIGIEPSGLFKSMWKGSIAANGRICLTKGVFSVQYDDSNIYYYKHGTQIGKENNEPLCLDIKNFIEHIDEYIKNLNK